MHSPKSSPGLALKLWVYSVHMRSIATLKALDGDLGLMDAEIAGLARVTKLRETFCGRCP
jgi:hypothetical protein